MAKIGRQQGARFHIDTLAVPGDDPVDGHGVPEVMEAGLPPFRRYRRMPACCRRRRKTFSSCWRETGVAASRGKKSGACAGGLGQGCPRLAVGRQHPAQILAGGRPRLKELGIPDGEQAFAEVDITAPQRSPSLVRSPAPYRTRSSVRYVSGCPGHRVEVKVPVAWRRRWSSRE